MKSCILLIDILMDFPATANPIMSGYLGLRVVKPAIGTRERTVHNVDNDGLRLEPRRPPGAEVGARATNPLFVHRISPFYPTAASSPFSPVTTAGVTESALEFSRLVCRSSRCMSSFRARGDRSWRRFL